MSGLDVVDRARADHYEQAMVFPVEDIAHHFAACSNGLQGFGAEGDFLLELIGSDQGLVGGNVKVVDR
ncbi:hypothetical protein D3C81_2025660 [compost metagenome]